MSQRRIVDARSRSTLRKLRKQRARAKIRRVCLTLALIVPTTLHILYLLTNGQQAKDENEIARPPDYAQIHVPGVTQQVTVVPEPNTAVFVGAGLVTLFCLRRMKRTDAHQSEDPSPLYPSNIAIAVA